MRIPCGRESGSRSSTATLIPMRASRTSAALIETAASSVRRPQQASAPCRCRRSRSERSSVRHTFATFALRAGISTFDLSRYMGASLARIDRHYGHLARGGRDHALNLLDAYGRPAEADVHQVDVAWTLHHRAVATSANKRR